MAILSFIGTSPKMPPLPSPSSCHAVMFGHCHSATVYAALRIYCEGIKRRVNMYLCFCSFVWLDGQASEWHVKGIAFLWFVIKLSIYLYVQFEQRLLLISIWIIFINPFAIGWTAICADCVHSNIDDENGDIVVVLVIICLSLP